MTGSADPFSNLSYRIMSDNGGYEQGDVSQDSPFLGKGFTYLTCVKEEMTLIRSPISLWMEEDGEGMSMDVLQRMCSHLRLPDPSDEVEAWISLSTACPLMSHLIPHPLWDDEKIAGMLRMLHIGGIKWDVNDVFVATRTALIGLGYERMEARIKIKNEYDDQSTCQVEYIAPFLMKSHHSSGFGGYEVDDAADTPGVDCLWTIYNHARKSFVEKEKWAQYSFVYDLLSDQAEETDIAVGMNIGRR